MICGARLTYNYYRIGGVIGDLTPEIAAEDPRVLRLLRAEASRSTTTCSRFNKIFIERTAGVGVIPLDMAINYGITGPPLRASGMKLDLRRDDPYSIYDRFDFDVPVGKGLKGELGDTWDRYYVRMWEMEESLKIIRQGLAQIPEGEHPAQDPEADQVPQGGSLRPRREPAGRARLLPGERRQDRAPTVSRSARRASPISPSSPPSPTGS